MGELEHFDGIKYTINPNTENEKHIIGKSSIMQELYKTINKLKDRKTTVLLTGESGTGKELFAQALHYNCLNGRKKKEFLAVNCAGISAELLESNLFGHEKGSFTGAGAKHIGKFRYAEGGTIFLDEITEMNINLQAKILRAIQEREVAPVGSNEPVKVNVRILAATNRNLEEEVSKGNFRQDLYYRLNVFPIEIPPLRERKEDIPYLVDYFIEKINEEEKTDVKSVSESAMRKLTGHNWYGNIRELENVVERAIVLRTTGSEILTEDIKFDVKSLKEKKIKRWFDDGVCPFTVNILSRYKGAFSRNFLRTKAIEEKVYFDSFPLSPKTFKYVLYLTPDNIDIFFSNVRTKDYEKVLELVKNGPFNEVAKNPFKLFYPEMMKRRKDLINNELTYNRLAKRQPYILSGNIRIFALTPDEAKFYVTKDNLEDYEKNIETLKQEITDSYARFLAQEIR